MPIVRSSAEDLQWNPATICLAQDDLNQSGAGRSVVKRLDDLSAGVNPSNLKEVYLDFGQIDQVSTAALSELIGINSSARSRGLRLVLLDVQEAVREVFAVTRLERLFEFRYSTTQA